MQTEFYFDEQPYRLTFASNQVEAEAQIKGDRPHLVLLDLRIPPDKHMRAEEKVGLDLLAHLHQAPDTSDLPVVVLSLYASILEKECMDLEHGAKAVMVKWPRKQELLDEVNRWVSGVSRELSHSH